MAKKRIKIWLAVAPLLLVAVGSGCEEDEGQGTLHVEIWGEDFIEEGIPAAEFVDGWSVTFDKFLVAVDAIAVARGFRVPDLEDDTQRIFDLTREGPYPFLTRLVPAGRYDNTSYRIGPAQTGAAAGNCSADDLALMRDNRYSLYVSGRATNGTTTKTFRWGFKTDTTYRNCESQANVTDGATATVQITIHADHLFLNDLVSEEARPKFGTIAQADANSDGEVTLAEMQAFDITGLDDYGTGQTGIDNLGDFVAYLTRMLGHIDGEGHCEAQAAER